MDYILASQSPRRRELLSIITEEFKVLPSGVEEIIPDGLEKTKVPEYLAKIKAEDIAKDHPNAVVIGADTSVILKNEILGKPKNREDAFKMLKFLSGNTLQDILP